MRRTADMAGEPYIGDNPQATSDREQDQASYGMPDLKPDYTVAPTPEADEYNFSMSGTHVTVSEDDHLELFGAMGYTDMRRPHAYGKLELHANWKTYWHVYYTNMSMHMVENRLKRYTNDNGWEWGGLLDKEGVPVESQSLKTASVPGIGEINPGVKDWKNNEWAGTEMFDNPADHQSDTPFYGLQDYEEDSDMTSPRTCSDCGQLMLNYDDWRKHILREHVNPGRKPPGEPQPVVDMDDVLPAGFNEAIMDKTVQRQSRLIYQLTAAATQQQIAGPMPFIFDVESDRIFVGQPGERHSDIKGRFTPGGIVEGVYDPKGSVQIRTDTDMPYTVRHMAELWYALHPELQIKSIYLMVGEKKYRLASANIGHQVRNITASDPAAWAAFKALEGIGGNVYAVGGVVRDIVLGKTPKDVDLMVQGVDEEDVQDALESLPGRVDYTGKQFGVFRYRDPDGNEVEIALPRTERSTGPGHRDFEVTTDPYISVGEDLGRRDFTGNAMAVNLSTGDLVDPHRGSEDLKSGVLRTVSDRSFLEDPLRILRAFGAISRHGLDPDPSTYHDLAAHAHTLGELPKERLQAELDKLISGDDPAKAIELMEATGVLEHVLPDVAATTGFDQKSKYHQLLLSDHIKEVLRLTAQQTKDPDVRWAALFHDIGKPGSQWFDEEGLGHYYKNDQGEGHDHETLGAEMTKKLLTELRFPNDRIERITHLVQHHMFPAFGSRAGARKYINRVGDEHADDLLTLRWADSGGKDKGNAYDKSVSMMKQHVDLVRQAGEPTSVAQLAINGKDLIAAGMQPGPQMGEVLKSLVNVVLENPALNTKEALLAIAFGGEPPAPPQQVVSNILDPIKDTLDPDVFNKPESMEPVVKPKIAEWVKGKIYKAMVGAGWPDPTNYLTVNLTGSLTTYQWGELSDFDCSLFIDVERFPEWVRADLIALMIEKCDGVIVPGTTHPLQCFVVDSTKFKPEDLYKPGLRSAYSLDYGNWIVLPEKTRSIDVEKRWPEHIAYARGCVNKMKMMLRYDKYAVKTYWDFLHRQRFLAMRAGANDYDINNVVYKMMSNEGLFPYIEEVTGEYIA